MQTSVELQDPFHYSIFLLIIMAFIVLIEIFSIIYFKHKTKKIFYMADEDKPKKDIGKIKKKYIEKLDIINLKLNKNKISLRTAYQGLSNIIRFFVFETTGVKVQNYTLSEIKELKIESLSRLIEECYVPEFSKRTVETTNINELLIRTKEIIERWS